MLKFIHLTDTHLVGRGEALYGTDPAWRLRAAVADILATQGDAAFCLITGDLTHRGGSDAFALLHEALSPLPMPVHLAVGNHDDRDDLRAAFPDSFRDADGFVQGRFDTPEGIFLILDTMEPGCSHGVFCDRRADWLARMLAESGKRPVYLCLHHPPFPVGIPGMDRLTLRETGSLERAIAPHRAHIRHMFFGHVHRPISGSWRGLPFSTLHGTNHQVALTLVDYLSPEKAIAAAAPVWGSHEPPHYGVVLIEDDLVLVHQRPFMAGPERFRL